MDHSKQSKKLTIEEDMHPQELWENVCSSSAKEERRGFTATCFIGCVKWNKNCHPFYTAYEASGNGASIVEKRHKNIAKQDHEWNKNAF